MDDKERESVYHKFADIAENIHRSVGTCELDGHNVDTPEHDFHDNDGIKWREWFCCPQCDEDEYILVCTGAHKEIERWAEEEIDKVDFFYCTYCKEDWSFMDVYYGGFPWG